MARGEGLATIAARVHDVRLTVTASTVVSDRPSHEARGHAETGAVSGSRIGHRLADDWPRTDRVMPWVVAAFLVALCLVPLDAAKIPVNLPFDSTFDRVALLVTATLWVLSHAAGAELRPRFPALRGVDLAMWFWVAVAFVSILINLSDLIANDELTLATKKFSLLLAYVGFFLIVVSVVRPTEVQPFITLWICVSCVTAVGAIWQYRTGANLFYDWTAKVLPSPFTVSAPPTGAASGPVVVTGPALHSLALTTMLTLPLPFVVQRILAGTTRRQQIVYAFAALLLLAASVATARKSAVVIPIVLLGVLTLYRPRQMWRLAPLGVVFVLATQTLAPGALSSLRYRAFGNNPYQEQSTSDRTSDYAALVPDLVARPVLGKGWGTYDPDRYRILDNQWLLLAVETGVMGVLAFLGILSACWLMAHRLALRQRAERAPPAVAAAAGIVAFAVAAALYDVLSFVQPMYLLFFIVALTIIIAERESWATHASPGT